jgi:ribosomal protein S8
MNFKYIAKRFIDRYVIGDEVDSSKYESEVLENLVKNGFIEKVLVEESVTKRGRSKKAE